ncbi:UNVERIFIED_CONTAM: hypothetical protein Slati_1468900 [Sesamum latifolium]|uniref:Reverse transcriptase Ty1/copia-type domain-containing protein n=1 Tax=Sesamum latifolium TaxID=2727402 RepID=A0AAW2X4X8_9LAMI
MSDIDLDKWLEAMNPNGLDKFKLSLDLVDPPKGARPVGCKWVYKHGCENGFLNGFVEEEIFMDQPEGFTAVGEEQKNDYDPCIYKKISGSSVAYLVLYVDDILLIGNDVKMLGDIKACLEEIQDEALKTRSPSHEVWIKLSKKQSPKTDEELKRMSNIPYALVVGNIQYVVQCTRRDVAYALSVTSRYQACAWEAHWGAVKSILIPEED